MWIPLPVSSPKLHLALFSVTSVTAHNTQCQLCFCLFSLCTSKGRECVLKAQCEIWHPVCMCGGGVSEIFLND